MNLGRRPGLSDGIRAACGMEDVMRRGVAYLFAISVSLASLGVAQGQQAATPAANSAAARPAPTAPPSSAATCSNPNALGVSRVVEIDTIGGPGFGFEHFKMYDFLRDHEVVLTFDDGPWPTTPIVLQALADECVKAIFFSIGYNATIYPEILKKVAAAGHTIGSHTWTHQDLSKTRGSMPVGNGKREVRDYEPKDEIEKGMSAVKIAIGDSGQEAPFFRFPSLKQPPELMTYLGSRNVAMFSTDFDSFDFTMRKPEQVVKSVMDKLKKHGKGIVLMHDVHAWTANAVHDILAQMKAGGYKVVQMKPKEPLVTLPEYDAMIMKEMNPVAANARPMGSVIRTVE
jgi:peptidoglycan/xylan/chitin deacetylase (PgdA/CDA1 family)